MTKNSNIIIAIGSNTDQQRHIQEAREELMRQIPDIRFTDAIWTEPIGMDSSQFLNCLAWGTTALPLEQLQSLLKATERLHGDSRLLRKQCVVKLDLDLLLYNQERLHLKDWHRPYIRELMETSKIETT